MYVYIYIYIYIYLLLTTILRWCRARDLFGSQTPIKYYIYTNTLESHYKEIEKSILQKGMMVIFI